LKPLLPPEALYPLDIDRLSLAAQGIPGFAKAPPSATLGKSVQLLAQGGIAVGTGLILESRTIDLQ
jgi:hypothetical protein